MTSSSPCPRRHELLRLRFGELDAPRAQDLTRHVEGCAACQQRLAEEDAAERAYQAGTDVARESAQVLARLDAPARAPLLRRLFAPELRWAAALAGVLLFALPGLYWLNGQEPGTRTKGGVALTMFVNDPQGAREARDGEVLREGDQIQFRYRANGRRFLFVVSVTDEGTLSPLYPDHDGESVAVEPADAHVLAGSVILDDSRGPERIFALFSDSPLSYAEVAAQVRRRLAQEKDVTRLRSLALGADDVDEASILIVKE